MFDIPQEILQCHALLISREFKMQGCQWYACQISNAMFDIPQEILQCHALLISREFKTQGCQWYGVKLIDKIYFCKKGK